MRIITLGSLAGIGEDDNHFYDGTGYLLRFSIESPEHFFAAQLPFIVDTLTLGLKSTIGFDIRKIMKLELLADGNSGLRHVVICISFEGSPSDANHMEDAIGRLCAAPSTPPSYSAALHDDILRNRLIDFFILAPNAVKSR